MEELQMLKSSILKNRSVATAYGEAKFDKDGISTNLPIDAQKKLDKLVYLSYVEDKDENVQEEPKVKETAKKEDKKDEPKEEPKEEPKKEAKKETKKPASKVKPAKKDKAEDTEGTEKSVTRANDETTEKEKAPKKGRKRSVTRAEEDKAE